MYFLANISKTDTIPVGQGALYSILAIVMVFAILLLIIGITALIFKAQGLFDMKRELDEAKNKQSECSCSCGCQAKPQGKVEIEDDDMMAAVLVATIDYQNEVKKDVKVLSVRRVN